MGLGKYVVDGIQNKVSFNDIFKSLRNKNCIKPKNVTDFIDDHHYFVRWFTCNDPSDGLMCKEPSTHHKKIHPSVFYEAIILQLAGTLDDGEVPPSKKAPKRYHKCDDAEDVPEDSLREVRKDVKRRKCLKETVSVERASAILSEMKDTDYNDNVYGPFNSSDSEDESYASRSKNVRLFLRNRSKNEIPPSSDDSDGERSSSEHSETTNRKKTTSIATKATAAGSSTTEVHSPARSGASPLPDEVFSNHEANYEETDTQETTAQEAQQAAARKTAVQLAAEEVAVQLAAEEAAAQQAAAGEAATRETAADEAAAQRAAALQAAADEAAALQAAAQEAAHRAADAQAAAHAAALRVADVQAAALANARQDINPHPQVIAGQIPRPNVAVPPGDPQQGQMFGVYNPAVDFPENMVERPDGYGILRQDANGW
ncbi:hypothetical protein QAD02_018277 [Eretmocerus hayati]|uniref:Uncharacterized protein n=1 Tax=Eretmocerus hayati TaxID=131215 RepID=A0ACC2PL37_9HYME|nr:hypothetical protein QAD02_018277 [Eretmocerus hayati]